MTQRWSELCDMARTAKWKKVDTHDGVTLARCRFGRGSRGHAVMKVEGVLPADPSTVYQFLQLSTKEGGKVRGEGGKVRGGGGEEGEGGGGGKVRGWEGEGGGEGKVRGEGGKVRRGGGR